MSGYSCALTTDVRLKHPACLALTRSISLIRRRPRIKSCATCSAESYSDRVQGSPADSALRPEKHRVGHVLNRFSGALAMSEICLQSASLKLKFPERTRDKISALAGTSTSNQSLQTHRSSTGQKQNLRHVGLCNFSYYV